MVRLELGQCVFFYVYVLVNLLIKPLSPPTTSTHHYRTTLSHETQNTTYVKSSERTRKRKGKKNSRITRKSYTRCGCNKKQFRRCHRHRHHQEIHQHICKDGKFSEQFFFLLLFWYVDCWNEEWRERNIHNQPTNWYFKFEWHT